MLQLHIRQLRCIGLYPRFQNNFYDCYFHRSLQAICNSPYYNLPKSQMTRIQEIEYSLARDVVKDPKSFIPLPSIYTLFSLAQKNCDGIEYKLLSLTYKVLKTTQPSYLHNVSTTNQPPHSSCSSSLVTVACPPASVSLQIIDRSFRYASPCLWNQLPVSLRQPHPISNSPFPTPVTLSSSVDAPLSSSITPSFCHFLLKTYMIHKSFPPLNSLIMWWCAVKKLLTNSTTDAVPPRVTLRNITWILLSFFCYRPLYFCPVVSFFYIFFLSLPNLSGRRLDVYHTSTHDVALVRIYNAGLKCAASGSLEIQDAKMMHKIAIWAPSDDFVGLYFRN